MPSSSSGAALRSAAAHLFVADVADGAAIELDEVDRHHLERVLRLRAGEAVTASDGRGSWRPCAYVGGGRVEPLGDVRFEPAPSPGVTIGFALTKGDKPEWVVQKLTEAGVDAVAPFVAARSVVRWDADKAGRNHERLVRVAREAAMQSRRVWLPEVRPVVSFDDAVSELAGSAGPVALAEPGGEPVSLTKSCLLVGPEGGWSAEEKGRGLPNVSLGLTILRAETATLAAGLLLCAMRAGVVASVGIHDR